MGVNKLGNPLMVVAGFILIGLASIMFLYTMPTIATATRTSAGGVWENSTGFTRTAVAAAGDAVILIPFLIMFGGFALVLGGFK